MLKTELLSSLVKVFSDENPTQNYEFKGFSMLKGERSSFQVALFTDADCELQFEIKGWNSNGVSAYFVEEIPSELPAYEDSDDYFLRKTSGLYPDVLRPVDGKLNLKGGKWGSLWIELDAAAESAGKHSIEVCLKSGGNSSCESVDVEIVDAQIQKDLLTCTMWFHSDCLATYYNVDVFSEEHWTLLETYIKNAVDHGINFLLTPLFTPPLDTAVGGERPTVQLVDVYKEGDSYRFGFDKLKRWVDMCKRCGVKSFEMSHLFTQWGAQFAPKIMGTENGKYKKLFGWSTWAGGKKYVNFLRQFGAALVSFIDENGIRERCYFHVSDEPSLSQYNTYKKRAALIEEIFPGFKVIDALSDLEFFEKGVVKYPIPNDNNADAFYGKIKEFWTYYCCGQHRESVPNRFFGMPSARNRILGALLYRYNAVGFLQWAYNFWYARLSVRSVDPFQESDAGKEFPSGDAYVVYPGEDGKPINSLRLKVFYDAVEDFSAMKLLESKIGREKVMDIIYDCAGGDITMKNYPHGDEFILTLRERINSAIKEQI